METGTMTSTKWGIDVTHTEIQFKVKHLVIATTTGFFRKFSGSIEADTEDFDSASVQFSLEANSIDTNQADRDTHLKSADFFAVAEYPTVDFAGSLKKLSGTDYELNGDLTIRGTTKAISFPVEFGGIVVDPWGNTKAGFEINGKINRKDFGLNWNALTEAGGMVVSEEVKIHINAELAKG